MVHVDETGKATFRFRHATSGPVFVVGEFCHWQKDHLQMRRVSEHEWMLMIRLPPGCYEFRYLADGQWFTDYAAFGVNMNTFKDFNSVLRIPRVRPAAKEPVRLPRVRALRMAASA
jgi:1,4-alpha-glucan branching enzyme